MSDDMPGESTVGGAASVGAGEAGPGLASSAGADQPASDSSTAPAFAGEVASGQDGRAIDLINSAELRAGAADDIINAGGAPAAGEGASSRTSQAIAGKNGGWIKPIRDSETARAISMRRWDKVHAAVRAEVAEFGGDGLMSGVRKMARAQVTLAASGKPGSTSAFNAVLRHADLSKPRAVAVEGEAGAELVVTARGAALGSLFGMIERMRQQGNE